MSGDRGEATLTPEVCAGLPRWMLKNGVTASFIGVAEKAFKFLPLPIEKGSKVEAPYPYGSYQYVFVVPGWTINDGVPKYERNTLANFTKVCKYYSAAESDRSAEEDKHHGELFEGCFGHKATTANIEVAFECKLLISPGDLPTKSAPTSKKKTPAKKAPAKKKKSGRKTASAKDKLAESSSVTSHDIVQAVMEYDTLVRAAFTKDSIDRNPHDCFDRSEKSVMSDKSLRSDFILLCKKYSEVESLDSFNKAYDVMVPKVCHARFGSVFRQWKAERVIKHENISLRTKLKVSADKSDKRKSADSTTTVTPGPATAKKARTEEAEPEVSEADVNIENMMC